MKKTEIEQWIKLGEQSKKVQEGLAKLLNMANKANIPNTITKQISTSFANIQKFKSQAEDRMFSEYPKIGNEALEIFYGESKKIKRYDL